MKTFGLGTAASMANRERYGRFTQSMFQVYSAMEEELDRTAPGNDPVREVWSRHGSVLRRASRLREDLADVDGLPNLKLVGATE